MLRQLWKEKVIKAKDVLMRERGKKFWGTKGPYIKKRMLLAFVEQLRQDHEALMENAIVESEKITSPSQTHPLYYWLAQRFEEAIASIAKTSMRKPKTKRAMRMSLPNARIEVIVIRQRPLSPCCQVAFGFT